MKFDEYLAVMENYMLNDHTSNDNPPKYYVKDIIRQIKEQGFIHINNLDLQLEEELFFGGRVPVLQIKEFYQVKSDEEDKLWLVHEDYSVSQRFWLYNQQMRPIVQWLDLIQRKCHNKKWKVMIEKVRVQEHFSYGCYKLNAGGQKYYNIVFQTQKQEHKIKGIFNCLYDNKKDFGILLEALTLLFCESGENKIGGN